MPRKLPPLVGFLRAEMNGAIDLPIRLEIAHAKYGDEIPLVDVQSAYELAFLRVFLAWEVFLESLFLRLLCGYMFNGNQEPLVQNINHEPNLVAAEYRITHGNFLLWHSPGKVTSRARSYFHNGNLELVISSNNTRLEYFGAVRHRIAHSQKHAKAQFDNATMQLAGRRYAAGRPGRFLRDWDANGVLPRRWITSIADEFLGLAGQLAP